VTVAVSLFQAGHRNDRPFDFHLPVLPGMPTQGGSRRENHLSGPEASAGRLGGNHSASASSGLGLRREFAAIDDDEIGATLVLATGRSPKRP
jgi:hypothetical protein